HRFQQCELVSLTQVTEKIFFIFVCQPYQLRNKLSALRGQYEQLLFGITLPCVSFYKMLAFQLGNYLRRSALGHSKNLDQVDMRALIRVIKSTQCTPLGHGEPALIHQLCETSRHMVGYKSQPETQVVFH